VNLVKRLCEKERYEVLTEVELVAIRGALTKGPEGLATHSGHWYKCRNGHLVGVYSSPIASRWPPAP